MSLQQPLATLIFTVTAGILSLIIASKTRIPSILFFLIFGIALGPEGADLIQPLIFRHNFPQYISLAVALILFEGGSTLKMSQFKDISRPVRNLLTVGVAVSLVGACLAARWIAHMSWTKSILFGAIMIVTGPTVVLPILKRTRVRDKLHNVLKWEAILIDSIGVIIAVVLFELLVLRQFGFWDSLLHMGARFVVGGAIGYAAGFLMIFCLSKAWLLRFEGEELGGLFVLFFTLLAYGLSEFILSESGLVTVTVAGIYFGNHRFPFEREIDHFKDQVVAFALSILFVLLASNLPISEAAKIPMEGLALIGAMVLLVRPLGVFLSVRGAHGFSFRERCFLAFMAPRGIVSASLASLFAIEFEERALRGRGIFLPLAFFVIAGLIVVYTALSEVIARWTGVREGKQKGVLIVGANAFGMMLAEELKRWGVVVRLIDSNQLCCEQARQRGLEVYEGNAFDAEYLESMDIKGVGMMIAMTPNHEVNVLSSQVAARFLGRRSVYRLWDRSDSWKSVTAHTYDQSWGQPVGSPLLVSEDLSGATLRDHVIVRRPLTAPKKMTEEDWVGGTEIPLFAITGDDVIFAAPGASFAAGATLVLIGKRPSPPADGSIDG